MKKVGIYSGTFDPVHEGHLAFARQAIETCGLDKVFFLVESRPRRKQGVKAFEHRVRMVQLALKNEPKFGSIVLEQQRFTPHETLPLLLERFKGGELFMLMGDDWLAHFGGWPHVDELVKEVRFIIGLKNQTKEQVEQKLGILKQTKGLPLRYQLIKAACPEFASSKIKQSLRRGHIPSGLPLVVLQYIQEQGLYTDSGSISANSS